MSVVKGEKYTGEVKATRSAVKTLLNSLKGCKGRARHQNYCEKGCTAGQIFICSMKWLYRVVCLARTGLTPFVPFHGVTTFVVLAWLFLHSAVRFLLKPAEESHQGQMLLPRMLCLLAQWLHLLFLPSFLFKNVLQSVVEHA